MLVNQWEYGELSLVPGIKWWFETREGYREFDVGTPLVEIMNALGAEGYELIAFSESETGSIWYIFKRPVQRR